MSVIDDILKKGGGVKPRQAPHSLSIASEALHNADNSRGIFLDKQPTLAQADRPRDVRNRYIHIDNDGTDSVTAVYPTGAFGIRGWLSAIYQSLLGTLSISAVSLPLPLGAATLAAQVAGNFPQSVDMGDAGVRGANFIGNVQTVPKGARSMIVTVITTANAVTWQPLLEVSIDGGVTWFRCHPVPTSATASAITASWTMSNPIQALSTNYAASGAVAQIVAMINMGLPPLWRIEYTNGAFTISLAKVIYN